jgi:hypothetical protein
MLFLSFLAEYLDFLAIDNRLVKFRRFYEKCRKIERVCDKKNLSIDTIVLDYSLYNRLMNIYKELKMTDKYAQIGSSANRAHIESCGDHAHIGTAGSRVQIESSGYQAQIGACGCYAQIQSNGNQAQIGACGCYAQIQSKGYYAQIASSGDTAQIQSSGGRAKIGSCGDCATIQSSGERATIASSGGNAEITAKGTSPVVSCAGTGAIVRVGENGAFCIPYYDGKRMRFATGYVGEAGIKSNTGYSVVSGEIVEVT